MNRETARTPFPFRRAIDVHVQPGVDAARPSRALSEASDMTPRFESRLAAVGSRRSADRLFHPGARQCHAGSHLRTGEAVRRGRMRQT